jgi:hypothetical protein
MRNDSMEIIKNEIELYGNLLNNIKSRVKNAQIKATLSANAEMILMYLGYW